eukprot:scaffold171653_cov29-Tisochrysis_lutea.AAC.3
MALGRGDPKMDVRLMPLGVRSNQTLSSEEGATVSSYAFFELATKRWSMGRPPPSACRRASLCEMPRTLL